MLHPKTIISICILMIAFTSCNKTFECHCEMRPDAQPISNWVTDYKIRAVNETKAAKKCDSYDNDIRDCSLQ